MPRDLWCCPIHSSQDLGSTVAVGPRVIPRKHEDEAAGGCQRHYGLGAPAMLTLNSILNVSDGEFLCCKQN